MRGIKLKIITTTASLALSLFSLNSFAAPPSPGWYTTAFGGIANIPADVNTTPSSDNLLRDNVDYDTAWDAGGALGYKSGPIRYEGEFSYITAGVNNFNLAGVEQLEVEGDTKAYLAMANVYYDMDHLPSAVVPYLGIGVGYAHINGRLDSTAPSVSSYEDSDNQFAYQGTAGLSWNFINNAAVTLAYRYVSTLDSTVLGERFQANTANLGVVYRFDQA